MKAFAEACSTSSPSSRCLYRNMAHMDEISKGGSRSPDEMYYHIRSGDVIYPQLRKVGSGYEHIENFLWYSMVMV